MPRVLYLHGSSAGPGGIKAWRLRGRGHEVTAPALGYPQKRSALWGWLWDLEFRHWFGRAVRAAQEAYDRCRPEVIVGSSMGGAVAMNLRSGDTPHVLIAPTWRLKGFFRLGAALRVKPATVLIHGERDHLVALDDSRRLLRNSPATDRESAGLVATLEGRLAGHLQRGPGGCETEGRLVVVRGEGHRCNGEAALGALLVAVEMLADLAGKQGSKETGAGCPVARPGSP
jgi:hypothetical protein